MIKGGVTTVEDERGPGLDFSLCFVCGRRPWDSRPVRGAGVVHYYLLNRPRSVPMALGPAPLVTYTFCHNLLRLF